jgi:hypothetical protein
MRDLTNNSDSFVRQCNQKCEPFTWTATADSILEKARSPVRTNYRDITLGLLLLLQLPRAKF